MDVGPQGDQRDKTNSLQGIAGKTVVRLQSGRLESGGNMQREELVPKKLWCLGFRQDLGSRDYKASGLSWIS